MNQMKFLEFVVADQIFGLDVLKVQEVTNPLKTTPLSEVSAFVLGITVFRGRPLAVIDLRKRFNVQPRQRGRVIVLKPEEDSPALLVDDVVGIRNVAPENLTTAQKIYRGLKPKYIEFLYERDEQMVIVLKISELLSSKEKIILRNMLRDSSRKPAGKRGSHAPDPQKE